MRPHLRELAMGSNKMRLGSLIERMDIRNSDGKFKSSDVRGMSIKKQFIPTKADMAGVSVSPYKIVRPKWFAYVPVTSRNGGKITIAQSRFDDSVIVSSSYEVFRVSETNALDPSYLFMLFNRPEFDRYARFNSWGSARETFSWEDLCDTEINLPPVEVQRKYVAIYEAMRTNQHAYESGLDDLKLTCDALLDRCKTSERWIRVGDCLEEVDRRNSDVLCNMAFGININKQFMVSKASSDDLYNYKLVKPGELAYSSMQTGRDKCIRIALHEGRKDIAVSPAYSIFQEKPDSMLSIKYLMVWFSRPEMDRMGWFLSDASVRANLDLGEFLSIKIPVPDKPVQDAVVKIYDAWKTRADINGRMKKCLKDICPILVKGSIEEARR